MDPALYVAARAEQQGEETGLILGSLDLKGDQKMRRAAGILVAGLVLTGLVVGYGTTPASALSFTGTYYEIANPGATGAGNVGGNTQNTNPLVNPVCGAGRFTCFGALGATVQDFFNISRRTRKDHCLRHELEDGRIVTVRFPRRIGGVNLPAIKCFQIVRKSHGVWNLTRAPSGCAARSRRTSPGRAGAGRPSR